jgi:hypothetical protein
MDGLSCCGQLNRWMLALALVEAITCLYDIDRTITSIDIRSIEKQKPGQTRFLFESLQKNRGLTRV